MAAATVARMAMNPSILSKIGKFLTQGGTLSKPDIIGRLAPEAAFAGIYAAMSPGTLPEKALEFATDLTLSGGLGLVAGGAARNIGVRNKMDPQKLRDMSGLADNIGSIAGGIAAWPTSEALIRGIDKVSGGPGMTSYEKLGRKEQERYEEQLRDSILAQYGLVSGINPEMYGAPTYLDSLGLG
jgi:hypothetical protein